MSKSTKIIAGLGVAAALGVAALPVASFAADYSATVPVKATVANSIKIEVRDNVAASPAWTAAQKADAGAVNAFADLSTVDFGNMAPGAGKELAGKTDLRVTTNYPAGYTISATTTDLAHKTEAGVAIPDFAADTTINTSGNTASGWGINVRRTTNTAAYLIGSANEYNGNSGATAFETQSGINGKTTNEYTIGYGINIAETQASGEYNGSATFKVASDAALDTGV